VFFFFITMDKVASKELIVGDKVFIGISDLSCASSRALLGCSFAEYTSAITIKLELGQQSEVAFVSSERQLSPLEITTYSDLNGPKVSIIIVNIKVQPKKSSSFTRSLFDLLISKGAKEIIIPAVVSFTTQHALSNSIHQFSFNYNVDKYNYPKLSPNTLIVDPLVASLIHFAKLFDTPTTFLFIHGNKITLAKYDSSSEALHTIIKALTTDFGLVYSLKFLETLTPNKIVTEDTQDSSIFIFTKVFLF